jgi:phage shock protein A
MSMKSVMKNASKYMLRSAHANTHRHGKAPCTPKKEPKPKPERAVDRHVREAEDHLYKAEVAVHEARNEKDLKRKIKKMDAMQRYKDKAYAALQRANC